MSRYFAGDIEPGDRITGGQVLSVSTDVHGGFAAQVVDGDHTVSSITPSDHAQERVLVRTMQGATFDLHRTNLVRLITKE